MTSIVPEWNDLVHKELKLSKDQIRDQHTVRMELLDALVDDDEEVWGYALDVSGGPWSGCWIFTDRGLIIEQFGHLRRLYAREFKAVVRTANGVVLDTTRECLEGSFNADEAEWVPEILEFLMRIGEVFNVRQKNAFYDRARRRSQRSDRLMPILHPVRSYRRARRHRMSTETSSRR